MSLYFSLLYITKTFKFHLKQRNLFFSYSVERKEWRGEFSEDIGRKLYIKQHFGNQSKQRQ